MKKKYLFISTLPIILTATSAVSCVFFEDFGLNIDDIISFKSDKFKQVRADFKNFSKEHYNIKSKYINLYFDISNQATQKNYSTEPYVSIEDMVKHLNGFFNINGFKKYNITNNKVIFKNQNGNMELDFDKQTIKLSSESFFNFVVSSNSTNYSRFLKVSSIKLINKEEEKEEIIFDLKKYNIKIYNESNKVLIPLNIFNTLFCSQNYYNLYYNGNKNVYGKYFNLNENDNNIKELKNFDFFNKNETNEKRLYNLNNLIFTLDNFYGLKEYKKINSFEDYTRKLKSQLLSTEYETYNKAYTKLIFENLNELHSSIDLLSLSTPINKRIRDYIENIGQSRREHINVYNFLEQKSAKLREQLNNKKWNIYNNFAYITLSGFRTAPDNQINNGQEENDSFEYMHSVLNKISKEHKEVKNIVIDLSRNGGGNIGAMYRVLGLLTNKNIVSHEHSSLSNKKVTYEYKVDANKDGNYNDNDAFSQYNYYFLISKNTFSAGNSFSGIVKELNIGKIIGQKSGGGTSSVLPIVLTDGTGLTISSSSMSLYFDKNIEKNLEEGVDPDISLEYNDFYDFEILDSIINNKNNN
ncbi:S41 family peptidase [Metamycoplasma gateae]|uniref:S41 family peptidase n=1 Tax=Metamycoplasma gateae TaxID=35769 RepID=A0ABZ2ANB1_9BACT|nr:S41 family peptidase [Metamycoplasma gateae]